MQIGNYYAVIPADVMADSALKPNAKLLYGMVAATATSDGCSAASNAELGQSIGVSPRSVTQLLACLEAAGYLRVELDLSAPSDGSSTRRRIWLREADPQRLSLGDGQAAYTQNDAYTQNCVDPLRQTAYTPYAEQRIPPTQNDVDAPALEADIGVCKELYNNTTYSTIRNTKTKPRESPQKCANAHAHDPDADEGFDRFWRTYPRKVDKQRARREWDALAPSPELVQRILAAVEREKQSPQWQDAQYIPHPRTWLHNRRWEAVTAKPRAVRQDSTEWW